MIVATAGSGRSWWDWTWIANNGDRIVDLITNHVVLAVASVAIGFALAFPLAILAHRFRWAYTPLLQVTTVLYTVPSVALFVLLLPWLGLSRANAIAALTIYSLLVLFRNTVAGLNAVPADVVDAANGMGYTPLRRFVAVELPLAVPVIFAGLRIAMVTAIGLAVIASIIGQPTLGRLFIQDAYAASRLSAATVGLLAATGLSVALDLILYGVQRALTPWTRQAV